MGIRAPGGAVGLALVAGLLLSAPTPARGMSLADVASFRSLNQMIEFSNFEVIATGSLAGLDLSSIQVLPTASGFGFELVGPLSASDGEIGDLLVRFDVDAVKSIIGLSLSFNGAASGPGSGASVTETFGGLNLQAFVFATGGGGLQLEDFVEIPEQWSLVHLRATKDILLDSATISGGNGTAVISFVAQDFALIPEPASALLVLLGLAATVALRRRA